MTLKYAALLPLPPQVRASAMLLLLTMKVKGMELDRFLKIGRFIPSSIRDTHTHPPPTPTHTDHKPTCVYNLTNQRGEKRTRGIQRSVYKAFSVCATGTPLCWERACMPLARNMNTLDVSNGYFQKDACTAIRIARPTEACWLVC